MFLKKTLFVLLVSVFTSAALFSQDFMPPMEGVSVKKISYIHMKNGKEIQGYVRSFKLKKGLIEEIKVKDMKDKKIRIQPEDISHMYLPISNFGKLAGKLNFITDATKWESDLNQELLTKDYIYMESTRLKIKKKTYDVMAQLLNPHFCSKIKVFHDPYAKESMSVGVGSMKLAGGNDKSYMVLKEGAKAGYKLERKNYDVEFKNLFGDCSEVMKAHGKDTAWSGFSAHVYEHSKCN